MCTALNSAILGKKVCDLFRSSIDISTLPASKNLQRQSCVEFALGHCDKLLSVAGQQGIGAAVFTGVNDLLTQH